MTGLPHHQLHQEVQDAKVAFCDRCGGALALRPVAPEGKSHLVCGRCGFIAYQNPKVVACAIPERGGRIYLIKRGIEPGLGKWTFPGGYVDLGEPVTEAALREIREEINLKIVLDGLVGVYSYPGVASVIVVYRATVPDGEPEPTPGIEVQAVKAYAPEDIPWHDLAFKSTTEALHAWLKGVSG